MSKKIVLSDDMLKLFRIDTLKDSERKILVLTDEHCCTRGFILEEDELDFESCETLSDMRCKFILARGDLRKKLENAMKKRIAEAGLDGLVKNENGKIGWLVVKEGYPEFHHRTKSGEMSKKASGWSLNLENYKPYEEGETK